MDKVRAIWATVVAFVMRRRIVRGATLACAVSMPVLAGGVAHATTTSDPLAGAGTSLVSKLVGNFTTYVIPAVATVILAVYAFKLIVKMGTRFLNRA